jgi:hypothetical protein
VHFAKRPTDAFSNQVEPRTKDHVESRFVGAKLLFSGLEKRLGVVSRLAPVDRVALRTVGLEQRHEQPFEIA